MSINNIIIHSILLKFKQVKTFVIKSDDYMLVIICYLFKINLTNHIYTFVTIIVFET